MPTINTPAFPNEKTTAIEDVEITNINFTNSTAIETPINLTGTTITTANKWQDVSLTKDGNTLILPADGNAVFHEKQSNGGSPIIYSLARVKAGEISLELYQHKIDAFWENYKVLEEVYGDSTSITSDKATGISGKTRVEADKIIVDNADGFFGNTASIGLDSGLISYTPIDLQNILNPSSMTIASFSTQSLDGGVVNPNYTVKVKGSSEPFKMVDLPITLAGDLALNATASRAVKLKKKNAEVTGEIAADNLVRSATNLTPVYYAQTDPRWASTPYTSIGDNTQTIKKSGCGPTAMAMAVSTLTGLNITPETMAKLAVENGYRSPNSGTDQAFYDFAATKYGLHSISTNDLNVVKAALARKDCLVIAGVYGSKDFPTQSHLTSGAHMELLTGLINENGVEKFVVQDPFTDYMYANHNSDGAVEIMYQKTKAKSIIKINASVLDYESYSFFNGFRTNKSNNSSQRYWIIKK